MNWFQIRNYLRRGIFTTSLNVQRDVEWCKSVQKKKINRGKMTVWMKANVCKVCNFSKQHQQSKRTRSTKNEKKWPPSANQTRQESIVKKPSKLLKAAQWNRLRSTTPYGEGDPYGSGDYGERIVPPSALFDAGVAAAAVSPTTPWTPAAAQGPHDNNGDASPIPATARSQHLWTTTTQGKFPRSIQARRY